MAMDGFTGPAESSSATCLTLLVDGWTMDSLPKYVGGLVLSALLGVSSEFLTWARRRY
eukprot:SAG31_NODE_41154_length_277_cov_0.870787_1_plen_57_part_01